MNDQARSGSGTSPEPTRGDATAPSGTSLTRRNVLRISFAAAGAAALDRAGVSLVGAQGTPAGSPAGGQVEGMIPSTVPGGAPAYTKVPPPFRSVAETPGRGGKVSLFSISYAPPPTPRGENAFWQELEKRLGISEFEAILTPQPEYGTRAAALLAGGDLPDLFYLNPGQSAAHLWQALQQGAFTDLTPYLTGDGLRQFPNLALIPEAIWNDTTFDGKIYGAPKPLTRFFGPAYRADWAAPLGLVFPFENAQQVRDFVLGAAKGDPDANDRNDTFGATHFGGFWDMLGANQMFRAPNNWRLNDDGSLTYNFETEEYRQSLEFLTQLYADGGYHPDAVGMQFTQGADLWDAGRLGAWFGSSVLFGRAGSRGKIRELVPTADPQLLAAPGHDGGQGVSYIRSGTFGFTGIPASVGQDEERLLELLRILDYLSAPFGSEEWIFTQYGLEGTHHTVDENGDRVLNDQGEAERAGLVYFVDNSEASLYFPGAPGEAELALRTQDAMLAIGIDDPTRTLYSPTLVEQDTVLTQFNNDRQAAIITGRDPLSAYDAWIAEWRSRGGDQIRQEFEQALRDR